ncbi:MAG: DUF4339 domain-containing protein, partial [Verrucomicrobia bacterium]|nr:DUF4339 domain-containing protein [Verrucomicrobiota bacterium]
PRAAMFRVKGADQKEYGPVGEDILRQWIQEGRMNRFSLVQKEGESGWKPLEQFPEFSEALAAVPAAVATPMATPGIGGVPVQPSRSEAVAVGDPVRAAAMVKTPALLILIMAVIGMILAVAMLGARGAMLDWVLNAGFPLDGNARSQIEQARNAGIGIMDILQALLGVAINVLVAFGAIKMQRLESWGLALTASILTVLPCAGCCCLIGIPIGIWALVVLNKPEVKAAFR